MIKIKTCANCKYNKYGQLDGPPCPECKFVDVVFPNKWQPIDPDETPCSKCERASERESRNEGCGCCNDDVNKISSVYINQGELIVEDCDGNEAAMIEVSYCPMCGRKLVEE